jgi:hypothetical protein
MKANKSTGTKSNTQPTITLKSNSQILATQQLKAYPTLDTLHARLKATEIALCNGDTCCISLTMSNSDSERNSILENPDLCKPNAQYALSDTTIKLICENNPNCNAPTKTPNSSSSEKTTVNGCPDGCVIHISGCDIKGNIKYESTEKIYHLPGMAYYDETTINPDYGERWFCTEDEAISNGWRKGNDY